MKRENERSSMKWSTIRVGISKSGNARKTYSVLNATFTRDEAKAHVLKKIKSDWCKAYEAMLIEAIESGNFEVVNAE